MKLDIQNLSVSYGNKTVFENVNFSVNLGGIVGFVGRNGAGKTTFFNLLAGLHDLNKGSIHFPEGISKQDIGFLQTENYHYPMMNGSEYLNLCSYASGNEKPELDMLNQVFQLPLFNAIESYSSGMKKKLFLFGLLLQKKDILILDEPYNGLDLESSLLLNKIIKILNTNGKTIILSSHIMGSLTNICDSIFMINAGEFQNFEKGEFEQLEGKLDETFSGMDIAEIMKGY